MASLPVNEAARQAERVDELIKFIESLIPIAHRGDDMKLDLYLNNWLDDHRAKYQDPKQK